MLRMIKDFERASDANLQVFASGVLTALAGNPNFPEPSPDLASVTTAMENFGAALAQAQDGGRSDIAAKNQKREVLVELLTHLGNYVVYTVAGDAVKAATSGFTFSRDYIKHNDIGKPENLVIENGLNPGTLKLKFDRVKEARSYVYQCTPDPLTDTSVWENKMGTVSKALFEGLQSGKKYWCRVGALGANGQTIYSEAVSRVVQ